MFSQWKKNEISLLVRIMGHWSVSSSDVINLSIEILLSNMTKKNKSEVINMTSKKYKYSFDHIVHIIVCDRMQLSKFNNNTLRLQVAA